MAKKIIAKEKVDINYKKIFKYSLILFAMIFLLCLNYCTLEDLLGANHSYINDFEEPIKEDPSIRKPAVAGIFYSSDKKILDENVAHYIKETISSDVQPSMIIVPHAGYEYSGEIAGRAYSLLRPYARAIKRVIIVGPSHFEELYGIALSSKSYFRTPLGNIPVDVATVREIVSKNSKAKIFDKAHEREHSIEVQLPFLQKSLRKFKIVPIAYGDISPEELATILAPYIQKKDTLIVFSADLSHYYDYHTATDIDAYSNSLILRNEADIPDDFSCGAAGINSALILAKKNNLAPKTINLKNSGDIIGKMDSVVGYGSWSFTESTGEETKRGIEEEVESLKNFVKTYKKELISIVTISLEDAANGYGVYKPSRDEYSNKMFDKGASFVTLTKNGELRGCIGTIVPNVSIAQDVSNSAYAAAMNDKRFGKLDFSELKEIDFSISLLTSLERIRYLDENDLISQIEYGLDGLLIIDGNRQGLLLPSVWRQVSNREDFLKELKLKAGISPVYWSNKIKVYRFRTVEVSRDEY